LDQGHTICIYAYYRLMLLEHNVHQQQVPCPRTQQANLPA